MWNGKKNIKKGWQKMLKAIWVDGKIHARLKELCAKETISRSMTAVTEEALIEKIKEIEEYEQKNNTRINEIIQ